MARRPAGTDRGASPRDAQVTDLALVRAGRAGAEAPGRRRGRPYRYDPGPMAKGPGGDKPEDAPGERDNPWAFWR